MKIQHSGLFFLFFFSIFFLSACSTVGGFVSKTGEIVSKTGEIIARDDSKEALKVPEAKPPEIKLPEAPALPAEIKIKVAKPATATVQLNTSSGLSQPRINVTVIQLKSAGKFSSSRLTDLESDVESALGTDFISKQSLSLKPGELKPLHFEVDPSAKAIGAFASYRELNQTVWRTQIDLPKATDTSYKVLINIDNKLISAVKL